MYCSGEQYCNQWAVKIVGDPAAADALALKHGLDNLGVIMGDYYLFSSRRLRRRSTRPARHIQHLLSAEPEVAWVEQQVIHKRVKRDFFPSSPTADPLGNSSRYQIEHPNSHSLWMDNGAIVNDPEWPKMWYLNRGPGYDHNVREAWQLGYTGRDVVVTILDDGLEWSHPDIRANYDPEASYDMNSRDGDPTPRYEMSNENRHGTRCAGEVAAVLNNTFCIVGIAYNAKIGGIRMLDGDVNDWVEAASLTHNRQHIDIYSASWGPDDDGRTVDGPGKLATIAFQEGALQGRNGKGSIFVWASGNGGRDSDSCNCDGYTNSIYTLSISSATEGGSVPWYSEACSSTLATTYSSGSVDDQMIATTDLHHECTVHHTGTSASAPLAAGICALTLEANRNLTWRDLQHIIVRTARSDGLIATDWVRCAEGRKVSHYFGYGLMDAGAMVRLARNWTTVPEQHECRISYGLPHKGWIVPHRSVLTLHLSTDGCLANPGRRVAYLEHVQARITISSGKRGNLAISLVSPTGTKSILLPRRSQDNARQGFRDWAFMTTHCWGEKASGRWVLEVQNDHWESATLMKWELVLYGTAEPVGPNGAISKSLQPHTARSPSSSGGVRSPSKGFFSKESLYLTYKRLWPQ
uniref:P/Homo B domain-containing protein n=1 Tax=Trichuris muris TaxID=70415 RepID=A0A5S6QDY8_TRIMR